MEELIRKAIQEVLAQKASCDFCSCYEGDMYNDFPEGIKALENELVEKLLSILPLGGEKS